MAKSKKGWTDADLALQWMQDTFEPMTREKADGRTRVLFMDGHSSHYSAKLLRLAKENNIEILGYPPHTTHALQGLDVVCFAKMKKVWKEEVEKHETATMENVTKEHFVKVFGTAYLRAFDPETVKAAFRATGIHPYNPDVITPEQMKPSAPFSILGGMPGPQPSPVRAVMAAFREYEPTTCELTQNTHESPLVPTDDSCVTNDTAGVRTSATAMTSPESSSASATRSDGSDGGSGRTVEDTASRMRILVGELSGTSSGSFLISKDPVTTSQRIAPPIFTGRASSLEVPDWSLTKSAPIGSLDSFDALQGEVTKLRMNLSLAHQQCKAQASIIENANATIIIQNIYVDRLNTTLHTKSKKAKDKAKFFPDGKGRHLTSDAFVEAAEELAQEQEAKESAKEARKLARAEAKKARLAAEAEWVTIKATHKRAVETWEGTCKELRKEGVRPKDLPPKPKCARKPKPAKPVEDEVEDDDEDSPESSDDDS